LEVLVSALAVTALGDNLLLPPPPRGGSVCDGRGREVSGDNQRMEGPNDATQQPANGGAQQEAEALAERQRQANGQHDN
jgi:hypothetical protein